MKVDIYFFITIMLVDTAYFDWRISRIEELVPTGIYVPKYHRSGEN